MKLLLNQCFPLKPEGGKPDSLKINDVEYALFLAPDVQASAELRQETLRFLETQFEADAFQEASWNAHCLYLRNEKGLRKTPSFALMQWTLPVRFWIFGDCQIVCVKADHSYTIFKPDTSTQWLVSEQWTQLRDTWLLAQTDEALLQPIAQSVAEAATGGIALEVFFYNQYLKFAHKRPITVVRVEAIVDLMAMPDSDYIKKRLNQLANSARPAAKLLIQNALSKKTIQPDWFGRVTKLEYKALETELELKRIEITLLEQQSQRSKVVELEGDLARKDLEINGLQNKLKDLNDKWSDLALVRKGAEATLKELDALKKAFDQLSLEKTHLIQQLKEAQSAHNQWVTRYESLSKRLENLQEEKQFLRDQLEKANTYLQPIQNQQVTPYELLSNQLKVVQAEKEYLQKVQNQSVAQNAKQLQDAQFNLQRVQNQLVTQSKQLEDAKKAEIALQKIQNQSGTQNAQLAQQLQDAQSNLAKLKTEKVDLQRVQNESVARYESLIKQLEMENADLQRIHNQSLKKANNNLPQIPYEFFIKQLKTEKVDLQRVQNESVAHYESLIKQLKTENVDLQQVHNQAVTRYESLIQQLKTEKVDLQKNQNESVAQENQNESVAQNTQLSKQLENLQKEKLLLQNQLMSANTDLQQVQNQSVTRSESLIKQLEMENADLQRIHNQFITQNEVLFKIAQAEILHLQKLLELKAVVEKQPIPISKVASAPMEPKPIIITPSTIKTKLPFEPELILVEGGTFMMGSNAFDKEKPIHQVTLSSYMIGKYPITQAQWKAVMGGNPSHFKGDNQPVENVSWEDAQDFISKLNDKTGKTYSLPTEAQWEFAARGGTKSKGFEYSGSNNLGDVAWYFDNSDFKTHPIDEKGENDLGIHDMSGNVWEWCSDWYGDYSSAAVTNPIGAVEGTSRVLRGGGWFYHSMHCRVAYRYCGSPSYRYHDCGFRVVSFP